MPSKPKNGKKSEIMHKGGRGLVQNHYFKLLRKNDISKRRKGGSVPVTVSLRYLGYKFDTVCPPILYIFSMIPVKSFNVV